VVKYVEGVGAKLDAVPFLPYGIFLQTHVPILKGGSPEHVISGVAVRSIGDAVGHKGWRSCKRSGIEPLGARLVGWVKVNSR
jgi:hypothetical protein